MKIRIDRKALETALKISPKPKECLVLARGKSLRICFPHDACEVEQYIPCDVVEEGGAMFNYATLEKVQKWVSCSKLMDLVLEGTPKQGYSAKFVGTDSVYRFACDSEADATWPGYCREQEVCEVKPSTLSAIVQRAKAIYDNKYGDVLSVRPSVTGAKVVWTDGYSMHTMSDECASLSSEQILLPVSAAQAIVKYTDASSEYVALGHTGARTEGVAVSFDTVERDYPDVTIVLNLERPTAFRITATALKSAVKQVSSCLKQPLIFRLEGDKLHLVAYDSGKAKRPRWEECARAEAWARVFDQRGEDARFCLDYAYVKTALSKADGVVEVSCTDEDSPVCFRFEDTGIDTIIMPMQDDFVGKSV